MSPTVYPFNCEDGKCNSGDNYPASNRWLINKPPTDINTGSGFQVADAEFQKDHATHDPVTNMALPTLGGDLSPSAYQIPSHDQTECSEDVDELHGFNDGDVDIVFRYLQEADLAGARREMESPATLSQPLPSKWLHPQGAETMRQSDRERPLWFDPEELPSRSSRHSRQRYSDRMLWAVVSYKLAVLIEMGEEKWKDVRFARIDAEKTRAKEKAERERG